MDNYYPLESPGLKRWKKDKKCGCVFETLPEREDRLMKSSMGKMEKLTFLIVMNFLRSHLDENFV